MRIALDLDGVLADSISVWVRVWNSFGRKQISVDDIIEWDFWKTLGITEKEFHRIFYIAWKNWHLIPPSEHDITYKVSLLESLGKVDIVSARPRNTVKFVMLWLERHGLGDKKLVLLGPGAKKHELGYDFYIDDSPINAVEIASSNKYVLLYDRPWNRSLRDGERLRRVKSLTEAYEFIRSVLKDASKS